MTRTEERRLVAALRSKAEEYQQRAISAWNPHVIDNLMGRANALRDVAVQLVQELAEKGRRG